MAKEPSTIGLTIFLWDVLDVEVSPAKDGEEIDREHLERLAKGIRALLYMNEKAILDAADNLSVWHDEENIEVSTSHIRSIVESQEYKDSCYRTILSSFDPKASKEYEQFDYSRTLANFDHSRESRN